MRQWFTTQSKDLNSHRARYCKSQWAADTAGNWTCKKTELPKTILLCSSFTVMVKVAFSAGLTAKNDLKQCDDAFIDLQAFQNVVNLSTWLKIKNPFVELKYVRTKWKTAGVYFPNSFAKNELYFACVWKWCHAPFLNTCCCTRSLCDRYTCEEGYSYFMQAFMRQGTRALLIGHAHIIGYVFVWRGRLTCLLEGKIFWGIFIYIGEAQVLCADPPPQKN